MTTGEASIGGAHICTFSDPVDYQIEVGGRRYRFEFSDRFGPLLIGKTGNPLRREPPANFLRAVSLWQQQGKMVENGLCIWRMER